MSLPVISVSTPLISSVINLSQISSVSQQSSSSSHNSPHDIRCFNTKESNSKSNDFPSTVIPVPPPLDDSVINPTHLSSVCQESSSTLHNTTNEFQAYSIPGRTSPDPSNTMPTKSTKNGSRNIYVCMVDVYKLTTAQQQQHAVMLLQDYHELCKTNDP